MKILITGSNGLVGSYLHHRLSKKHDVIGLSKTLSTTVDIQLDLTDSEAWGKYLDHAKPDVVIHTAALTWVDYSEEHQAETDAANVAPMQALVDYAKKTDHKPYIIFFSTDYVYDGTKQTPYTEADETNPLSYYAKSKLKAEKILETFDPHLILRPEGIFGWHTGKNFFMQVYRNLKEGKEMKVVDDMVSNPTYVETLVDVVEKAIEKKLTGTFIATGPESLDRYSYAKKIAQFFQLPQDLIIPAKSYDFPSKAKRPMHLATDSGSLQKKLEMKFPNVHANFESIAKLISEKE